MYWNYPSVTISSLQRTTKPLTENDMVCVFKNSEPSFYTIKPRRLKQLLDAEQKLKEIQS